MTLEVRLCKHANYACEYDKQGTCTWTLPGVEAECKHDEVGVIVVERNSAAPPPDWTSATEILARASACIGNRAAERDQPSGERSMARCVAAYNALTGQSMTELQGWMFMAVLKMARSQGGRHQIDDYIDGAAYMALAGEAAK